MMRSGGGGVTDKSPSHICHTIRHTSKHLFINKLKTTVTDVTDFYEKNFFLSLPTLLWILADNDD